MGMEDTMNQKRFEFYLKLQLDLVSRGLTRHMRLIPNEFAIQVFGKKYTVYVGGDGDVIEEGRGNIYRFYPHWFQDGCNFGRIYSDLMQSAPPGTVFVSNREVAFDIMSDFVKRYLNAQNVTTECICADCHVLKYELNGKKLSFTEQEGGNSYIVKWYSPDFMKTLAYLYRVFHFDDLHDTREIERGHRVLLEDIKNWRPRSHDKDDGYY